METSRLASPAMQLSGTERLRAQAVELEGVFLQTLVKEMFSTVQSEGAFDGGFAEETWRGLQAEQFAAAMAEGGGIGLADQILGDLLAVQEAHQNQTLSPVVGAYRP